MSKVWQKIKGFPDSYTDHYLNFVYLPDFIISNNEMYCDLLYDQIT